MPTIETKISMALREAVQSASGGLPIAWHGDNTFAPPVSGAKLLPYIAVGKVQTATRVLIGSGAAQERTGILTLSYVAPMGKPEEWYVERASGLLLGFPLDRGKLFQGVCVKWGNPPAVPRVDQGYSDGGYYRTPVLIPWRCAA